MLAATRPDGPAVSAPSKFAHTRALLNSIYREYHPDVVPDLELHPPSDDPNDPAALYYADPDLLARAASFLQDEDEDALKALLKDSFGVPDNNDILDEHVLNLMHKQRDDLAGVPFLLVSATRRPLSRPSSRASTHSFRARPETPSSIPSSPLGVGFRRPHTPLSSPMNPNKEAPSYMSVNSWGGRDSPSPAQIPTTLAASSSPSSPLSSPKMLNAKATEFRPIPRPLSSAGSHSSLLALRAETPSPDLWSHKSSNLAIAAPLVPDNSLLPTRTSSALARHTSLPDDEEHDEFDPFAIKAPPSFHPIQPLSDVDSTNSNSTSSQSKISQLDQLEDVNEELYYSQDVDDHGEPYFSDGMTPLDVLSSVFGSSVSQPELDEALENNGYDFEAAMQWLIDKGPPAGPHGLNRPPFDSFGSGRILVIPREGSMGLRGSSRGGRGNLKFPPGRVTGNKVCRYFLAGECMRADCRFSHDLDRALCRFWLRGMCAKGESCEFLHRLPKETDIQTLTMSLARQNIDPNRGVEIETLDEFPSLGHSGSPGYHLDRSRSRFAAAVKRAPPTFGRHPNTGMKDSEAEHGSDAPPNTIRSSPRIRLRMPSLLPTLPTGEVLNSLYMSYRSRALQLGAARNASLSKAAEAWRRGDGATAKRFSREGQELNGKMKAEAATAAMRLVRERAKVAMDAVRNRDASWSDDPGDRAARGRVCGGGLGVCLGVGRRETGEGKLGPEERTEVALDLHGLHSGEATEVLEEYLLSLEKEHFLGIAYLIVGEQKHTGSQDPSRGVSRLRLAAGVREWLQRWGYPFMEREGIIAVDPLTHFG